MNFQSSINSIFDRISLILGQKHSAFTAEQNYINIMTDLESVIIQSFNHH